MNGRSSKRIVILGAGLLGVSAAWVLLREGHEVVVIDRHHASAQGTSFANGGHIASGDALPWTSFDFVLRLLSGMIRRNGAAQLHLRAEPAQWLWLARLLLNVSGFSWGLRARCLLALAAFSQACLIESQHHIDMDFKASHKGVLHLFSGRNAFAKAKAHAELMMRHDIEAELCAARQCILKEPALTKAVQRDHVRAGVFFPHDKTGDARLFTEQLAQTAAHQGASFLFEHNITGVATEGRRLLAILTDKGEVKGDIFILALGAGSAAFAKHFGLSLPVYPLLGYSVTMRTDGAHAPHLGLVDESRRIVISRLGDQLRLAGLADIGALEDEIERRAHLLMRVWRQLLPQSADGASAKFWRGARPMTPDSLPILGLSAALDNLYLNTGHGALGWTLCHASARLIADLIARRPPAIDPTPFSLSRFSR